MRVALLQQEKRRKDCKSGKAGANPNIAPTDAAAFDDRRRERTWNSEVGHRPPF
jgi:hypothetical protein